MNCNHCDQESVPAVGHWLLVTLTPARAGCAACDLSQRFFPDLVGYQHMSITDNHGVAHARRPQKNNKARSDGAEAGQGRGRRSRLRACSTPVHAHVAAMNDTIGNVMLRIVKAHLSTTLNSNTYNANAIHFRHFRVLSRTFTLFREGEEILAAKDQARGLENARSNTQQDSPISASWMYDMGRGCLSFDREFWSPRASTGL